MIVVSGTIALDPSNHAAAAALMQTLAAETVKEAGNLSYGFYADLVEAGSFRVFEEWKDQESLDSHFSEPHMATFMEGLGALGITGTNVIKYVVSESSKLM